MPRTLRNLAFSLEVKPVVRVDDVRDNEVVPTPVAEDKELVLMLVYLRDAIDELGWKHDAVAVTIGVTRSDGSADSAYFSKMLAGEKPFTLKHLAKLPDDINERFSRKCIENFHGGLVVQAVTETEARRQLATGLISLLSPGRAKTAKAGLR